MPKILIVVDPEDSEHRALNRIKEISTDAATFKVDYYLQSPDGAKDASSVMTEIEIKRGWLSELVQPYINLGYKIETEVLLFHRLYESIIKSADIFGAELVFKPLRRHQTLRTLIFTPTDWKLVRVCPCPILFVTHGNSIKGEPVVAAIDIASADAAHQALNQVVLEQTQRLANVLNADVHLVHAYHGVAVSGQTALSDPLANVPVVDRRKLQFSAAYDLAASINIPQDRVHLGEGAADEVVNRCAAEINAGVVVIGTVARSGTAGLLIGNTAESVLEGARSDVFVVKQAEFISPVKVA